jgi:hypothetical protein
MADKKPYTISQGFDGMMTLTIAGMSDHFKDRKVLHSFALQLAEEISNRRTGIFHLQDMPDGTLGIVMHKSGHIIKAKDYEQAMKLAEMLCNETGGSST